MILIPAIDLKEGHCVRLRQGNMDETTVFSDDPVAMAGKWAAQGCSRLHLVDLDGAFEGEPVNADVIEEICASFPNLPIQIGGGIRNIDTVESYLEAGVSYVILGTMAVKRPEFITQLCAEFPGKIIVGIDANNGMVAVHGWAEESDHTAKELALRIEDEGVPACRGDQRPGHRLGRGNRHGLHQRTECRQEFRYRRSHYWSCPLRAHHQSSRCTGLYRPKLI